MHPSTNRVLVPIPAYNEEATIDEVVHRVRESLPDFDLLVVNEGSRDATGQILQSLGAVTATHLCNLGYGDGQHRPEQVQHVCKEGMNTEWDVLIGSRHVKTRSYSQIPCALTGACSPASISRSEV